VVPGREVSRLIDARARAQLFRRTREDRDRESRDVWCVLRGCGLPARHGSLGEGERRGRRGGPAAAAAAERRARRSPSFKTVDRSLLLSAHNSFSRTHAPRTIHGCAQPLPTPNAFKPAFCFLSHQQQPPPALRSRASAHTRTLRPQAPPTAPLPALARPSCRRPACGRPLADARERREKQERKRKTTTASTLRPPRKSPDPFPTSPAKMPPKGAEKQKKAVDKAKVAAKQKVSWLEDSLRRRRSPPPPPAVALRRRRPPAHASNPPKNPSPHRPPRTRPSA
jgi:hypothetical protein